MKTASKRKMSGTVWRKVALGSATAILVEMLLTGIISLLLVSGTLPDTEGRLYVHIIIATAAALAVVAYCHGEDKIIAALGICTLNMLIHCALNIIIFSGTFRQVGMQVLSVILGGVLGLLPGMKKKSNRKYKIGKGR